MSSSATVQHHFPHHTWDTAPGKAKADVATAEKAFGFLPSPVALMASSPQLLQAFLRANGLFNQTSLGQLEREVVILTIATRVECHYCVAMHTAVLTRSRTDASVIEALRDGAPLEDGRLEALRAFTRAVMDQHGAVQRSDMEAFLANGFTRRSALDVVLGVGVYTMSTYANRMTAAPVDEPFAAFAWEPGPASA